MTDINKSRSLSTHSFSTSFLLNLKISNVFLLIYSELLAAFKSL